MRKIMECVFPGGCLGLLMVAALVSLAMGVMVEDYKKQINDITNERDYWRGRYDVLVEDYCRLEGSRCD